MTQQCTPHLPLLPLYPGQVQRYLTPRMLQTAAEHGIILRQIDYQQPLAPQGPFNVIIHKLRPDPGRTPTHLPCLNEVTPTHADGCVVIGGGW